MGWSFGRKSIGVGTPFLGSILGLTLALPSGLPVLAASGDAVADRVLGQTDFTSSGPNLIDGRSLWQPGALALDPSVVPNRLYVADQFNNRVLGWRDAAGFRLGRAADLVLGQPDFAGHDCNAGGLSRRSLCLQDGFDTGLAVDGQGNLYVSDGGNRRVLEYDAPFSTDSAADRVFGQAGFSTRERNCEDPQGFCLLHQLAVDGAGNLFAGDFSRVLEYDRPLASDTLADRNFGYLTDGHACAPEESCAVWFSGVAVDPAGNLFVSDFFKQWVLVFLAPTTTDTVPDGEVGRAGLGVPIRLCNEPLGSASTLCQPRHLATDGEGRLYVADERKSRIAVYDTPLVTASSISRVLGPADGDLDSVADSCASGAALGYGLCLPRGVAVDAQHNVFVADSRDHRVLRFDRPFAGGDRLPDGVLGQVDFAHATANRVDARGLAYPSGAALDRSVEPNRLYVADSDNGRILGWRDAQGFRNGAPADLVIGQPDFFTAGFAFGCSSVAASDHNLCLGFGSSTGRNGLAVDRHGNLFVTDTNYNRVVEFDQPFATDGVADRVYGQADFHGHDCNAGGLGAGSLCGPTALAVDGAENLYIADTANQRVVIYGDALGETRTADRVLGQGGSFQRSACSPQASAANLCAPLGLTLDGRGRLYVSDSARDRVLRFDAPLTGNGTADQVLGQRGRFDTLGCRPIRPQNDSICSPAGLAVDGAGRLLIASKGTGLVARFRNLERAPWVDLRIGQFPGLAGRQSGRDDFTQPGATAERLSEPQDVVVDDAGGVYVVDSGFNRLVVFDRP